MANEHNARWASSIWLLFRIDHNTISPSSPSTSTTSTSPTGWSDIYLIVYIGATEADLKRWIWKNDWSNVPIWPNDRTNLGQMTERILAKRPNETWPNDRTIRENGERRYPRMKKLRTILPSAGIAMILFMTVGIDTNYINLNSATLWFNFIYKFLSNKKLLRILPCQIFHLS